MNSKIFKLEQISNRIRLNTLEMVIKKQKGHLGGTFSCIEILVTLYCANFMKISEISTKIMNFAGFST